MSGVTRRNLSANYIGTAWNAIMSVAFVPSYLAYLGAEAYGIIGLSAIIASTMTTLDLGLVPMLTREVARYRGGVHRAESIRSLIRLVEVGVYTVGSLGLLSIWLASDWIASDWLRAQSMQPTEIANALRMLSAVVGLRFIEGMYRGVLIGLQRQVLSNVIASLAATLRGAGSLGVLAWWSPTLNAFLWWQFAVSALSLAVFAFFAHAAIPSANVSISLGMRVLRSSWPFARGMILSSVLVLGLTQVDKLLLSRLLPLAEYGQYSFALVAASCVAVAASPIGQAIYPRLTEMHARGDAEGFRYEFHRMAQLVSVVAGSIGAVVDGQSYAQWRDFQSRSVACPRGHAEFVHARSLQLPTRGWLDEYLESRKPDCDRHPDSSADVCSALGWDIGCLSNLGWPERWLRTSLRAVLLSTAIPA